MIYVESQRVPCTFRGYDDDDWHDGYISAAPPTIYLRADDGLISQGDRDLPDSVEIRGMTWLYSATSAVTLPRGRTRYAMRRTDIVAAERRDRAVRAIMSRWRDVCPYCFCRLPVGSYVAKAPGGPWVCAPCAEAAAHAYAPPVRPKTQ